jgi:hypothetical protein
MKIRFRVGASEHPHETDPDLHDVRGRRVHSPLGHVATEAIMMIHGRRRPHEERRMREG